MDGSTALLASLLLVVSAVAIPAAGSATGVNGAAGADVEAKTPLGTSNASSAPGTHLAGVVGVQEAEIAGELEGRTFEIRVNRARSKATKAGVVADEIDDLNRRLTRLRERKATLLDARQNGSISRARFRVEIATLAAEIGAVNRQVDRVDVAAQGLPTSILASNGVDSSTIETLRRDGGGLAGPEVATIARSIAGPDAGGGLAGGNATQGPANKSPRQGPAPTGTDSDGSPHPGGAALTDAGRNESDAGPSTPTLPTETPGGADPSTQTPTTIRPSRSHLSISDPICPADRRLTIDESAYLFLDFDGLIEIRPVHFRLADETIGTFVK